MSCVDDDTLARHAAGALDLDAIAAVDEHVDECDSCRRVVAETVLAAEELEGPPEDPRRALEPELGRYRILRLIGSGGMGVVFEALDKQLGSRVALKTLRDVDGPMLLRLKNEFRTLADLRHPNLVQLGDLVQENGRWFFTMELVRGRDLLSYVRPGSVGFDELRLRECLTQLTAGLGALHGAHNLVRRGDDAA